MRNKMISRITMASIFGIGVVALAFACDNTTPTPTPTPDLATPPDMTMLPDLMPLAPTATMIAPVRGPAAGGTAITITGTNFKTGASVTVGGVAATQVVVTPTSITAMTGASTTFGAVDVVVDNKDGSPVATIAKGFRYFIANPAFTAANANTAAMSVNGPRSLSNIMLAAQGFPSLVSAMGTGNVAGVAMQGVNVIPNTTAAPVGTAPTFAATQGIPTGGTNVINTAVGDMNGDGQADVVATNAGNNTVTVIHRNGVMAPTVTVIPMATGTFNQPVFVTIGDFDMDGKVNDIAVTNAGTATVSILKNNGNMTYTAMAGSPFLMTTGAAGYNPYGIDSGDFDGDGRPDVVVGNVGNNTFLRVILNKAGGWAVQGPITAVPAAQPNIVKVGDFDGDNKLDFIAVSRQAAGVVAFYKGDGLGGFTKPNANIAVGSNPEALAVGDLNQDGFLDLVVPNFGTTNLHWMTGKGDGTFNTPVMINSAVQTNGVAIGDYNGDGKPDFAITGFNTGNVIIYRGSGT